MEKTHFEVVIAFDMTGENSCTQKACDAYLDAFLKVIAEEFASTPDFVRLTDLVVKNGPKVSDRPLHSASIHDLDKQSHYS